MKDELRNAFFTLSSIAMTIYELHEISELSSEKISIVMELDTEEETLAMQFYNAQK